MENESNPSMIEAQELLRNLDTIILIKKNL